MLTGATDMEEGRVHRTSEVELRAATALVQLELLSTVYT